MKMVNVATFDTIIEASISKGRLEAEGVPCWLADEHIVQTDMLASPAIGGIKLQVSEEWQQTALDVLAVDYSDIDFPYDKEP